MCPKDPVCVVGVASVWHWDDLGTLGRPWDVGPWDDLGTLGRPWDVGPWDDLDLWTTSWDLGTAWWDLGTTSWDLGTTCETWTLGLVGRPGPWDDLVGPWDDVVGPWDDLDLGTTLGCGPKTYITCP